MDEALAVAGRFEVGVLFSAGELDVPHTSPRLVQLQVNWVHTGVVRGHSVAHVHWDVVLLEMEDIHTQRHICEGYIHKQKLWRIYNSDRGHGGT